LAHHNFRFVADGSLYRYITQQLQVNRQPGLSPSIGQRLHAYQTSSVVKAAFLTEATSQNRNCKTCIQPSCSNCLERSAARLTFCWDTNDSDLWWRNIFTNWLLQTDHV